MCIQLKKHGGQEGLAHILMGGYFDDLTANARRINMVSKENRDSANPPSELSGPLLDGSWVVRTEHLLPGDILVHRAQSMGQVQKAISSATGSPYTHASIFLGNGRIAESNFPLGVDTRDVGEAVAQSQCIGVLRTQMAFCGDRPAKLSEFVETAAKGKALYDWVGAVNFKARSDRYFNNQLDYLRENYGRVATAEEFAKRSFFCSAFVVACYSAVGLIGESAQAAYPPEFFSPAGLYRDPTFGWLLGYLVPHGQFVPKDDPLMGITSWRDCMDGRWWA